MRWLPTFKQYALRCSRGLPTPFYAEATCVRVSFSCLSRVPLSPIHFALTIHTLVCHVSTISTINIFALYLIVGTAVGSLQGVCLALKAPHVAFSRAQARPTSSGLLWSFNPLCSSSYVVQLAPPPSPQGRCHILRLLTFASPLLVCLFPRYPRPFCFQGDPLTWCPT